MKPKLKISNLGVFILFCLKNKCASRGTALASWGNRVHACMQMDTGATERGEVNKLCANSRSTARRCRRSEEMAVMVGMEKLEDATTEEKGSAARVDTSYSV